MSRGIKDGNSARSLWKKKICSLHTFPSVRRIGCFIGYWCTSVSRIWCYRRIWSINKYKLLFLLVTVAHTYSNIDIFSKGALAVPYHVLYIFISRLSNFMESKHSGANGRLTDREFDRLFWNMELYYPVHKHLLRDTNLSLFNPILILRAKIRFNSILPSAPLSP
jgi:hypothetical protein